MKQKIKINNQQLSKALFHALLIALEVGDVFKKKKI